jgi:4-diphosphocytidyl-2-C-methyl-D-erythritol kinase
MTSFNAFSIAAPAKINLYLHVTGRRDDGFHQLDSLVAFASMQDTLTFFPADDLVLEIEGPFAPVLRTATDNLVLQAARALADMSGVDGGARIVLTKRLPLASGIGGGSADAAATLKGLVRLWGIRPRPRDLYKLALKLGADVPVCLNGRAVFIGGAGEELSPPLALPAASLVLVNPGIALSTPAVFRGRAQIDDQNHGFGRFDCGPKDLTELIAILKTRHNDLAPAALKMAPEIGEVLAELECCAGALITRMSGSGATCFCLFADPGEAAAATFKLSSERPNWWVRACSLEADINNLN